MHRSAPGVPGLAQSPPHRSPPAVPLQHAESRDSDEATVPGDAVDLEQQLRSTDPEYDDEERRFPFDTSSVEDVASTLFTCANWVLQVVVVVYLNESAEMGAGNYTWVSTFVAAPLAANIVAVICWLLYSPAKGFLRKLESEPDVQVLLLLFGTISTDALTLLSTQDEDRAIVRTLGLISNFLADIPFFAIELNLILSGSRSPLLVASVIMNLLSIGLKLTRNWIILILSYNRWRRFRRVRAATLGVAQNFNVEDAMSIPYALAFWLVSLFFTAMLSTQPLFEPRLAPGLESLGAEWQRVLVSCYYGAVAAFLFNAAANGALWTAYLASPRFSHEWMLRAPLLTSLIAALGLIDASALNAFTQNAMWHARVLSNGLLVRLLAFDFPILVISWRAHVAVNSRGCLRSEQCSDFLAGNRLLLTLVPVMAMISVWWRVFRLIVCHVTSGTHGGDVGLEWRDAQLQPLSAEKAFALSLDDDDDGDINLLALAAESAATDEEYKFHAALSQQGAPDTPSRSRSASPLRRALRNRYASKLRLPPGARGASAQLAAPLRERTSALLFGLAETPDRDLQLLGLRAHARHTAPAAEQAQGSAAWLPSLSSLTKINRGSGGLGGGGLGELAGGGKALRAGSVPPRARARDDDHPSDASEISALSTVPRGPSSFRPAPEFSGSTVRTARTTARSRAPSTDRRGSNASSVGTFHSSANTGQRKGRGRARRGKERAGSAPSRQSTRQAAIDELAEEDYERKRQQRLNRGRALKKARNKDREDRHEEPIFLSALWSSYMAVWGQNRWVGQVPMAVLCLANLVSRLQFVAAAWRVTDTTTLQVSFIGQLCIGVLACSTLCTAVAAAYGLRRGAAPQLKASFRSVPSLAALALTVGAFDPELAAALLEGSDALLVSAWSLLAQDIPWLVLQALALGAGGGGSLVVALGIHVGLLAWKLVRILVLALSRGSPAETTTGFFLRTRWGDVLPVAFGYAQLGIVLALVVNIYWLRLRLRFKSLDITVGPSYSAQTDALLDEYIVAAIVIILLGAGSRLCVVVYFLCHPAFAHRGIYRHSMFASCTVLLSLGEGSVFSAVAKSLGSYKVLKMATALTSLVLYDVPITALHLIYYFAFVDFDKLGVSINGRGLETLLRATTVVSIVCLLYRLFNLVLIKATLSDGEQFDDSPLVTELGRVFACCTLRARWGDPRKRGSKSHAATPMTEHGPVDAESAAASEEDAEADDVDRRV